ncbi:MAG: MFS transporter [Burkholderiales bacterium]|nr:MFS transporter [Burkholderiales bacterium]
MPDLGSAFAPLRQRSFALLWLAAVAANIGGFMRDVASAWVVTEIAPTPAWVALVQATATLPVFLLAIPAGVLADILDRRRLLLMVQLLLVGVSLALAALAGLQSLSLPALLALALLGGLGAALMQPTWQAVAPDLVGRALVRDAVALNSLGINIARALGPAAGGLLLGLWGPAGTFGLSALGALLLIAALLSWRRPAPAPDLLVEHFLGALRAGLRYTRASRELHRVLWRAAAFFGLSSAAWALLPLVTRQLLGGTASFYGLLLGAVGAGAVLGALVLPRLRQALGTEGLMAGAAIVVAAVLALLGQRPPHALALALMGLLGVAWIAALTTLGGVAQAIFPSWVRGRGLAVYLTVFNGALTLGSLAWGGVAEALGMTTALHVAAAGLLLAAVLARRWPLPDSDAELGPSSPWPAPPTPQGVALDQGPVIVQLEYRVQSGHRQAMVAALYDYGVVRRRDGAMAWGLAEDVEQPEVLVEWFIVDSWAEHLRQHQRATARDAALRAAVLRWHTGDEPPRARHLLTVRRLS